MAVKKSNPLVNGIVMLGVVAVFGLVFFFFSSDDIRLEEPGGADGILGGEFTLTGVDGAVSLSDYRGKMVIVYFGFVNCTQVCPLSMQTITRTLNMMKPDEVANIQVILVSIDGEDTPESLAEYVQQFHPNIIGVTGSVEQIDAVINDYGAFYDANDLESFDIGRAYTHSSRYFIVDQQGGLVSAMRHSSTANEIRARLRQYI